MRLCRYRAVRPLFPSGRVIGACEVLRLEEKTAAEWVASGHLVALDDDDARDLGPPPSSRLQER